MHARTKTWQQALILSAVLFSIAPVAMAATLAAPGTPVAPPVQVQSSFDIPPVTDFSLPIAADALGNYLVAWNGYAPGLGSDQSYLRLFDMNGNPRGEQFRAENCAGLFFKKSVSMAPNGKFVVACISGVIKDGSPVGGIRAQVYHADGSPQGLPIDVPLQFPTAKLVLKDDHPDLEGVSVAMKPDGSWVLAWAVHHDNLYTKDQQVFATGEGAIYAQRYNAQNEPVGALTLIEQRQRTGLQATWILGSTEVFDPYAFQCVVDGTGDYSIVWKLRAGVVLHPAELELRSSFYMRSYHADGTPLGLPTQLSLDGRVSPLSSSYFSVTTLGNDRVLAWSLQPGTYVDQLKGIKQSVKHLYMRRYSAYGVPKTAAVEIATAASPASGDESLQPFVISSNDAGTLALAWIDPSLNASYGEYLSADGKLISPKFPISTGNTLSALVMPNNNLLTLWGSLFAQVLQGPPSH